MKYFMLKFAVSGKDGIIIVVFFLFFFRFLCRKLHYDLANINIIFLQQFKHFGNLNC